MAQAGFLASTIFLSLFGFGDKGVVVDEWFVLQVALISQDKYIYTYLPTYIYLEWFVGRLIIFLVTLLLMGGVDLQPFSTSTLVKNTMNAFLWLLLSWIKFIDAIEKWKC